MRTKPILMAMFLLAGTANAFAGTNSKGVITKRPVATKPVKVFETKKIVPVWKKMSCTVSVSFTGPNGNTINATITNSCDNCTQQQACDGAYAVISVIIPG